MLLFNPMAYLPSLCCFANYQHFPILCCLANQNHLPHRVVTASRCCCPSLYHPSRSLGDPVANSSSFFFFFFISYFASSNFWRFQSLHHPHHHHLFLNRKGRWGTTDDFIASFLHFLPVLHCPLGLGELQACPFLDVVLPLPLSALSFSHSVLPVVFVPYLSLQLYISL